MVADVAYPTIITFFLCWWPLGLLLQRISRPRLRKRQEAHLQMVLLSEAVVRATPHREQTHRNHLAIITCVSPFGAEARLCP